MLDDLRELYVHNGYVSGRMISADRRLPTQQAHARYLGSLERAFELAGLPATRDARWRAALQKRSERAAALKARRIAGAAPFGRTRTGV